jgi:hypothetical protein
MALDLSSIMGTRPHRFRQAVLAILLVANSNLCTWVHLSNDPGRRVRRHSPGPDFCSSSTVPIISRILLDGSPPVEIQIGLAQDVTDSSHPRYPLSLLRLRAMLHRVLFPQRGRNAEWSTAWGLNGEEGQVVCTYRTSGWDRMERAGRTDLSALFGVLDPAIDFPCS